MTIGRKRFAHAAILAAAVLYASAGFGAPYPDETQCRQLWRGGHEIPPVIEGWCIFIDRKRGNCLACHGIGLDEWPRSVPAPGNIGPYLHDPANQYPNGAGLREIIFDPSTVNSDTVMPLYGRHQILSAKEIDALVRFLSGIRL